MNPPPPVAPAAGLDDLVPQVLVVGEAVVDVLRSAGSETRRPGGSPANVAVALARLGVGTALVTCFADDDSGSLLAGHLEGAGVQVLRPVPVTRTSTAVALLDDERRASYDIDLLWDISGAAELSLDGVRLLHVGSVAATAEPGCHEVLALVERARSRGLAITYDVNCRPDVMGTPDRVRPVVERLAALVDLVKLSDEDALWLYGDRDPLALLHQAGAPAVVLTRGPEGCVVSTGGGPFAVPAAGGGPVVDTVGAGDAFMAGLIAGWPDLHRAVELASVLARRTCERVGADPPTAAELGRR